MPRVRLFFGLRDREGRTEFTVPGGGLCEVLARIQERITEAHVVRDCGPAPGHLIFVNGVDVRLLDKRLELGDEDVIDIVPVNHPG